MNWRPVINIAIALAALAGTATLLIAAWLNRFDPVLSDLVVKNFPAIIGLPFAFIAAFVVVALFRQGSAPIEFTAFGVSFKGASGEIILWVLCFLAVSGSLPIRLTHTHTRASRW